MTSEFSHSNNEAASIIGWAEEYYYESVYHDPFAARVLRLHCTICDAHIGCPAKPEGRIFDHPILRVLVCESCKARYGSGAFQHDANGRDLCCRWCGCDGKMISCCICPNVFCENCILRNFEATVLETIRREPGWLCFICNPTPIWKYRGIYWALQQLALCLTRMEGTDDDDETDLSCCCPKKGQYMSTSARILSSPGPRMLLEDTGLKESDKSENVFQNERVMGENMSNNLMESDETVGNKNIPSTSSEMIKILKSNSPTKNTNWTHNTNVIIIQVIATKGEGLTSTIVDALKSKKCSPLPSDIVQYLHDCPDTTKKISHVALIEKECPVQLNNSNQTPNNQRTIVIEQSCDVPAWPLRSETLNILNGPGMILIKNQPEQRNPSVLTSLTGTQNSFQIRNKKSNYVPSAPISHKKAQTGQQQWNSPPKSLTIFQDHQFEHSYCISSTPVSLKESNTFSKSVSSNGNASLTLSETQIAPESGNLNAVTNVFLSLKHAQTIVRNEHSYCIPSTLMSLKEMENTSQSVNSNFPSATLFLKETQIASTSEHSNDVSSALKCLKEPQMETKPLTSASSVSSIFKNTNAILSNKPLRSDSNTQINPWLPLENVPSNTDLASVPSTSETDSLNTTPIAIQRKSLSAFVTIGKSETTHKSGISNNVTLSSQCIQPAPLISDSSAMPACESLSQYKNDTLNTNQDVPISMKCISNKDDYNSNEKNVDTLNKTLATTYQKYGYRLVKRQSMSRSLRCNNSEVCYKGARRRVSAAPTLRTSVAKEATPTLHTGVAKEATPTLHTGVAKEATLRQHRQKRQHTGVAEEATPILCTGVTKEATLRQHKQKRQHTGMAKRKRNTTQTASKLKSKSLKHLKCLNRIERNTNILQTIVNPFLAKSVFESATPLTRRMFHHKRKYFHMHDDHKHMFELYSHEEMVPTNKNTDHSICSLQNIISKKRTRNKINSVDVSPKPQLKTDVSSTTNITEDGMSYGIKQECVALQTNLDDAIQLVKQSEGMADCLQGVVSVEPVSAISNTHTTVRNIPSKFSRCHSSMHTVTSGCSRDLLQNVNETFSPHNSEEIASGSCSTCTSVINSSEIYNKPLTSDAMKHVIHVFDRTINDIQGSTSTLLSQLTLLKSNLDDALLKNDLHAIPRIIQPFNEHLETAEEEMSRFRREFDQFRKYEWTLPGDKCLSLGMMPVGQSGKVRVKTVDVQKRRSSTTPQSSRELDHARHSTVSSQPGIVSQDKPFLTLDNDNELGFIKPRSSSVSSKIQRPLTQSNLIDNAFDIPELDANSPLAHPLETENKKAKASKSDWHNHYVSFINKKSDTSTGGNGESVGIIPDEKCKKHKLSNGTTLAKQLKLSAPVARKECLNVVDILGSIKPCSVVLEILKLPLKKVEMHKSRTRSGSMNHK